MTAIHDLSALEQAAAIRDRELSPVDLAEHYLARIERLDPVTGAFVTVTADEAILRAKEAERAVIESSGPLPALHGVPIGFKDLHHTAGVRTTMGSALHLDFVPDFDDHAIALLRRSGVNSLGKTNVPEFGYPFYTENLIAPPARTPWDLSRSAGGSSGGAAAAVAAGLLPFAHASDGGGSLRVPASVCGLFGIKPSRGRVSNGPVSADTTALSCHGPIARTVADAAALLDAMAVSLPTEAYHAPSLPPGETFSTYAGRPPGRLRIGRYLTPCMPDVEVDASCRAAWEHASGVLEGLGHEVVDVPAPFSTRFWEQMQTIHGAGQSAFLPDPDTDRRLTPLARWMREAGRDIPAGEFLDAMRGLRLATRAVIERTAGYDALLTPTLAAPPRPVGWFTEGVAPSETVERIKAFAPFTAPYNVTGQPAVSVPLWWTPDGLPIGVMLAGRPFDEATLLSLSAQLEEATGWRHRHPELW
ncbi:amidase [Streptomyces sp. NPDC012693]|jgi:amidase|uniref:amidase n=1 Tax=unclassified Streptomyces TaxID=2593676 RepID=UPI0020302BAC|nr:amidase [Streptomyces sp. MSC1_001]